MAKSKNLNLTMIVSVLVILLIIGYLVYTGLNIKDNKETFNDNDYPECINVKFFIIDRRSDLQEWWKGERYGTKWTQAERNKDLIDDQLIYKMLRNEDGTPTRKIPNTDYSYTYIYEIIPAHKIYINNGRFGGMRKTYIGVRVRSNGSYWYVISPNGTTWGNAVTAQADYNLSQDTDPDQGIRFRWGPTGPTTARILAGVCPSNTTTAMPTTTPGISNMANVMWGSSSEDNPYYATDEEISAYNQELLNCKNLNDVHSFVAYYWRRWWRYSANTRNRNPLPIEGGSNATVEQIVEYLRSEAEKEGTWYYRWIRRSGPYIMNWSFYQDNLNAAVAECKVDKHNLNIPKRQTLQNVVANPKVKVSKNKDDKAFVQCCIKNEATLQTPKPISERAGVQWCPFNTPIDASDLKVFGSGSVDQRTYDEAKEICNNIQDQNINQYIHEDSISRVNLGQEYDLCTHNQIENNEAADGGCLFDYENVWIRN